MPVLADRVLEVSTSTGTGALALAGAVPGFRMFLAGVGDGARCYYTVEAVDADGIPTGAWEVGIGTYTAAGSTLTRDTVLSSSNGGALVDFPAGGKRVFVALPSAATPLAPLTAPGGRLTLTSGVPVTTSDVTAAGTVYYTPCTHDLVELWDGYQWRPLRFSEVSHSLSGAAANTNHDIYGYLSGGALALERLAWSSAVARATAVSLTSGRWTKSGDPTRLLLGTVRTLAAGQCEDSLLRRFVSNVHNRGRRPLRRIESTASWTYNTASLRQANASTANQVEVVACLPELALLLDLWGLCQCTAIAGIDMRIGQDSVTVQDADCVGGHAVASAAGAFDVTPVFLRKHVPVGYHYYAWLEQGVGGGTTTTFYGNSWSGLTGWVEG